MIHVVAVITAKPGERAAILDAFRANVPRFWPKMVASNTVPSSTPPMAQRFRPQPGRIPSW